MTISIKPTEKDYIMLVNKRELYDKAIEMGYDEPILFEAELDEDDYKAIRESGKNIAMFAFPENDEEKTILENVREKISDMENEGVATFLRVVVGGDAADEYYDADEPDLKLLIKAFPTVEEYERRLMDYGVVLCRDFTNRCGNCHSYLGAKDKYCIHCGTERGKGEFKPFENQTYCVYGPPVKSKFKCTACGHIWITGGLGGTNSRYCPDCGKKTVNRIEYKALDDMWGYIFGEEPFDVDEMPSLFTEEQVLKLLEHRNKDDDPYDRDLLAILREIGLDFPEEIDYGNMTEMQGEQLNLATKILRLQGDEPGKEWCHYCGRTPVASYAYDLDDEHWNTIMPAFHNTAEGKSLLYPRRSIQIERDFEVPAYFCLCCGRDIKELEIDAKVLKEFKLLKIKKTAEKGAGKVGKTVVQVGSTIGKNGAKAAKTAKKSIGKALVQAGEKLQQGSDNGDESES